MASKTSSRNTAFPAPIKPGQGLAHVKRTTKTTDQVVARRCRPPRGHTLPGTNQAGKGFSSGEEERRGMEAPTNALLLVAVRYGSRQPRARRCAFLLLSVVRCGAQHFRK